MEYPYIVVLSVVPFLVLPVPAKGHRQDNFFELPLDPDVLSEIDDYGREYSFMESLVRFLEVIGVFGHRIKRKAGRAFQRLANLCEDSDHYSMAQRWGSSPQHTCPCITRPNSF